MPVHPSAGGRTKPGQDRRGDHLSQLLDRVQHDRVGVGSGETRHWQVLEQDRELLERMEPDGRERLYSHDRGLARHRRYLTATAREQLTT